MLALIIAIILVSGLVVYLVSKKKNQPFVEVEKVETQKPQKVIILKEKPKTEKKPVQTKKEAAKTSAKKQTKGSK
jgi:hypothetical protein